jgi:hypothetical protein
MTGEVMETAGDIVTVLALVVISEGLFAPRGLLSMLISVLQSIRAGILCGHEAFILAWKCYREKYSEYRLGVREGRI